MARGFFTINIAHLILGRFGTLEKMFSSHSHAHIMQTWYKLATLKKGNLSIQYYFQKAKNFADILSTISQYLGQSKVISYISVGLPSDYDSLITSVTARMVSISLDDLTGIS